MAKSGLLYTAALSGALLLAGCNNSSSAPAPQPTGAVDVSQVPAPPASDADAKHSAFLAAAEPFENLTEQAPSATPAELQSLIAEAKKAGKAAMPALEMPAKLTLQAHLDGIDAAAKSDQRTKIALSAVEGYRTLVENASDTDRVPRAVSLLDYSGFRYQADLSAQPVRWDDARQALDFAQQQWSGIEMRVTDAALRKEFADSLSAMADAADKRDAAAARKAATAELDLVDKLEGFFAKP